MPLTSLFISYLVLCGFHLSTCTHGVQKKPVKHGGGGGIMLTVTLGPLFGSVTNPLFTQSNS